MTEHDAEDADDIEQQQHPLGPVTAVEFRIRPELRHHPAFLRLFFRSFRSIRQEPRGHAPQEGRDGKPRQILFLPIRTRFRKGFRQGCCKRIRNQQQNSRR